MATPEARARQQGRAYQELADQITEFANRLGIPAPDVLVRHKDPMHTHTVRAEAIAAFFATLTGAVISVEEQDGITVIKLSQLVTADGAEEQVERLAPTPADDEPEADDRPASVPVRRRGRVRRVR